jgi:hypothetical protein
MNLEPINSAMQAAYDAALVNPVKQAPAPVGDDPTQTVQTVVYEAPTGSGFRIVGRIKVDNYTALRVTNHGPDTKSARDWPADIEGEAEKINQAAQVKSAWDAAAAAFESLPLGKQALWEPVRVKVAAFIKKGDFAAAAETISTVPNLYTGMATDRDAFLALFQ